VRVNYKSWPLPTPNPAFPKETSLWLPLLNVKLDYPARHSPPTRRFEAFVDSGSPDCFFHADIGRAIGVPIKDGAEAPLSGIISTGSASAFFHDVGLHVGTDIIRIRAGFCDQLSVAGILGRRGFFDNFMVTFDHAAVPPAFEIQRIHRA
jgi:hypothetical protein